MQEPKADASRPLWNLFLGMQGCGVRILIFIVFCLFIGVIIAFRIHGVFGMILLSIYSVPTFFIIKYTMKKWREWQGVESAKTEAAEEFEATHCAYALAKKQLKLSGTSVGFHTFIIDVAVGGGWLPRYDYPVQIVPFTFDLKPLVESHQSVWTEDDLLSQSIRTGTRAAKYLDCTPIAGQ